MEGVQPLNPNDTTGVEQYIFNLEATRTWVEQCTRLRLSKDAFLESLSDGVVLCRLMLCISPRSVPKINEPEWLTLTLAPIRDDDSTAVDELISPRNYSPLSEDDLPLSKRSENVLFFLEACRDYGLQSSSICSEQDVFNRNGPQIVACLQDLADLTKAKQWDGPQLLSQPVSQPVVCVLVLPFIGAQRNATMHDE